MKVVGKISRPVTVGRIISAVSMICLLIFLTCANQFLYGGSKKTVSVSLACNDEEQSPAYPNSPAGPDEKSPDTPVSVNEELIHFHETYESPFGVNAIFEHMIHEAGKLCVVHLEYLTPPPNA